MSAGEGFDLDQPDPDPIPIRPARWCPPPMTYTLRDDEFLAAFHRALDIVEGEILNEAKESG